MTSTQFVGLVMAGLMVVVLTAPVQATQHKSFFEMAGAETKYSPGDFKPAPEKIETRFGNLAFPGGYPVSYTHLRAHET